MVAEHSQESGATDSSVPVETPEAEVSSTAAETPELVEQLRVDEAPPSEESSETAAEAVELSEPSEDSVGDIETVDEVDVEEEEEEEEESTAVDEESGEIEEGPPAKDWYILKVQVNREDSIRLALLRRIKIEGLEEHFDEIVVPTENVVEFNKSGKRKIVKKKLYPGYILVHMAINDDTWFLIRETPGVGDFTGSAGKPTPMDAKDVERILRLGAESEDGDKEMKTSIPFKTGNRVRVKDGHFQNFEGEVESVDEANGRITVMINIFNRSTPVELEHWQVEFV